MYLVFDLDATLADISSIDLILWELSIAKAKSNILDKVYNRLVQKIACLENKNYNPLGIIRPGVIDIMNRIKKYKESHMVHAVIIYSNNLQLASLKFVSDVIHMCISDSNLIVDLIHRHHYMRYLPGEELTTALPNTFPKTWRTLKRILIEGKAKAPKTLKPKDVIFIDDMIHLDLMRHLPTENYIHIRPYKFQCSFVNVSTLYFECLQDEGIFSNTELYNNYLDLIMYCDPNIPARHLRVKPISFYTHMEYYLDLIKHIQNDDKNPPKKDYEIIRTIVNTLKMRSL